MLLKSFLSRWVVVPGLALLLCLGLVFSQSAIAASITAPDALEITVNEFLQAIPRGFYGVQDVSAIQDKIAEGKTLFIRPLQK